MKPYAACLLVLVLGLAAFAPAAAQGDDQPLLRLLAFVPSDATYTDWLTYGDIAAWNDRWNVSPPADLAALQQMEKLPHAQWLMIMPYQTVPPQALGVNYMMLDEMRPFYGFDIFDVDRAMEAGSPPSSITVVEHHADPAAIAAALTASGYASEELQGGWTLFRLGEDAEFFGPGSRDIPRAGMLGALNRIALNGNQMIIARATAPVMAALDALGDGISLAEQPFYGAVARALGEAAPADAGDLIGALFAPAAQFQLDPMTLLGRDLTQEQIGAFQQSMQDPANQLPPFALAGFGTQHAPGATFLTVAVALGPGADADAFTTQLADRMQRYVSLVTRRPLSELWAFDDAGSLDVDGTPVAWVRMRVDDPPRAAEGEPANTGVFAWVRLLSARDYGFLVSGMPVE